MRYGAGTIKWIKEELQEIDKKSRKIMTMNKELHPTSDVARICAPRKMGKKRLDQLRVLRQEGREQLELVWKK